MAFQSAMQNLSQIGWGLIKNILTYMAIGVGSVVLFFIVKFIQKNSKKQKSFNINAIIVDMNGVIDFDTLAFIKGEDTGLLEMIFKIRKSDSIPPIPKHLIRNGYAMLLNYAPGHYCVIDTAETIDNIQKGIIIPYNLGMKKYITAKQREIMNKAENKKKKWDTYAPWITLGIGVVVACVLAWALFFFGLKLDQSNMAARANECKILMGVVR